MCTVTPEQEAAAVLDGLTQTVTCDECGTIHKHGKKEPPAEGRFYRSQQRVECECGRAHGDTLQCDCGTTLKWGPKAGGRMVARKHNTWKKREKRHLSRIAELEKQLASR